MQYQMKVAHKPLKAAAWKPVKNEFIWRSMGTSWTMCVLALSCRNEIKLSSILHARWPLLCIFFFILLILCPIKSSWWIVLVSYMDCKCLLLRVPLWQPYPFFVMKMAATLCSRTAEPLGCVSSTRAQFQVSWLSFKRREKMVCLPPFSFLSSKYLWS